MSPSVATPTLVLASGSPRRADILRSLGVEFDVLVTDADESLEPGEDALAAAERLARLKAQVARARAGSRPILTADTVVVRDGTIYGKPVSAADAERMLGELQGGSHEVVTGVCVTSADGILRSGIERTEVILVAMTRATIEWYVGTGEPLDKAGAYHIHGLGATLVERVNGSPSNVAGLPARLAARLLAAAGVGPCPPAISP